MARDRFLAQPSLYEAPRDYGYASSNTAHNSTSSLDWNQLVVQPTEKMLANVVGFIPDLLVAIYTLVFGWIIAKVLQFVTQKFLTAIRFDTIAEKIGMKDFLNDGKSSLSATEWTSRLIFWITMFMAVIQSLDALRLRLVSNNLDQALGLIVTACSILLIVILGMFLSVIVAKIVRTTAQNINLPRPALYANAMQFAILTFTLMIAFIQLGLRSEFILIVFAGVFVTLCLTFIIAFGIGGRQWAGKVLDKIL